jgi:AbrB family looped-hinge helix DNA binding protein
VNRQHIAMRRQHAKISLGPSKGLHRSPSSVVASDATALFGKEHVSAIQKPGPLVAPLNDDHRANIHSFALDPNEVRRHLTRMTTKVSTKGQIVLPAELRREDEIRPGQQFDIERIDRGEYRLIRRANAVNAGVVQWLVECPAKGFFMPVKSESTDSL